MFLRTARSASYHEATKIFFQEQHTPIVRDVAEGERAWHFQDLPNPPHQRDRVQAAVTPRVTPGKPKFAARTSPGKPLEGRPAIG